jgi:hypothetical protein
MEAGGDYGVRLGVDLMAGLGKLGDEGHWRFNKATDPRFRWLEQAEETHLPRWNRTIGLETGIPASK